ncbi:MAG: hypothetical protein LBQ65_09990 [Tannerellaceae bacterium]|jgi:hypothetical protein|nr:hypothetical protein [Tannerellaceae bacterium]
MERQTLYCELDFLLQLLNNKPAYQPSELEESRELAIWKNYVRLFLHNACIFMDAGKEAFYELSKTNKFFTTLLKHFISNQIDLRFYHFEEMEAGAEAFFNEVNPHALFFMGSTERCKELAEDYGMIFVSNELRDDFAECIFGYEIDYVSINKKESSLRNWDFIARYRHPCNSLIIADNYILADNKKMKNNLLKLIDKLLPEKLERSFQLTIITGSGRDHLSIEGRYKFLAEQVHKLRDYRIELKIVAKSTDNHDRNILTNYLWINSGFGFTIFKGPHISANTHFSINPIAGKESIREVVESLKTQYKRIEQEGDNIGSQISVMPKEKSHQISSRLLRNTGMQQNKG